MTPVPHPRGGALFGWPVTADTLRPGRPAVVGAPVDSGNLVAPGPRFGPARIRAASAGFAAPLHDGVDCGDVDASHAYDLAAVQQRLAGILDPICRAGALPILLGGDHALSFPAIACCARDRALSVLWLDAHTDFAPWDGDGAANHKQVLRRVSQLDGVHGIVLAGYRGYTIGDVWRFDDAFRIFTARDCQGDDACASILAALPPSRPVYVSIDIDVLDPQCAPGTSTPVAGGLSPFELERILRAVCRERTLAGLDVMEVNPLRDEGARTARIAAGLLHAALAAKDGARP
jgi:agmatinase